MTSMPASLSLRQGMAANCSPPLCLNIPAFSWAISSSVSRQSAEKPGVTTAMRRTPSFASSLDGLVGIGLQPLVGAERDWNVSRSLKHPDPCACAAFRGRDALRQIGVALVDVFFRHAVKRRHDQLRLERQCLEMRIDGERQRLDIVRIVVIGGVTRNVGCARHRGEHAEHFVAYGGRCRSRILRIERHHQERSQPCAVRASMREAIDGLP